MSVLVFWAFRNYWNLKVESEQFTSLCCYFPSSLPLPTSSALLITPMAFTNSESI